MPLFRVSNHQFTVGDVVERGRWGMPFGLINSTRAHLTAHTRVGGSPVNFSP